MTDKYTQHASMYIGDATAERIPRATRPTLLHVLDQNETLVETLENKPGFDAVYWDDMHHRALKDNIDTYEFTTVDTAKNRAAEYLIGKNKLVVTDHRGNQFLFIIEHSERVSEGGKRTRYVEAYGDHYRLRTAGIIEPATLQGATLHTAAEHVLSDLENGVKWQVGIVEYSGIRTVTFDGYTNPLKALHHVASTFDVELRFRVEFDGNRIVGKYVDFLHPVEIFDGKEIVHGKDMVGIRRIETTDEIYTTMVGVGPADEDGNFLTFESVNNGKNYIEDEEAVLRWGRHWYVYSPETEDQGMTAQRLKSLTETALQKHIESVAKYEVKAVALDRAPGYDHENVELGYYVRMKDEDFNPALYLTARVIEERRSYTDPTRDEFLFGNYVEHQLSPDKMIQDLQKLLFRNANRWSASYQKAIDALEEASEAKETADGKIDSFYQSTPPTGASEGDLWFNTEAGNKVFRYTNGTWEDAQDSGIGQALDAASDAQATADGKVTTFFSTTTPTAEAVGDLWYNSDNSELRRWSGSGWGLVSDVTGEKTAKDTSNVGGTSSGTVRDNASRGNQAKQTVDTNKSTWDRANNINSDGTFNTNKLKGQIEVARNTIRRDSNFFWDENGLKMVDPNDPTRYALHTSGGSEYHKGMIYVEREDGFPTIVGGKVNMNFAIGHAYPPFTSRSVHIDGGWWYCTANELLNCQFFSFRHEARYLKVRVYQYAESWSSNAAIVSAITDDLLASRSSNARTKTEDSGAWLTVDFGTPTGNYISIYFRLGSTNPNEDSRAYGRIANAILTDNPDDPIESNI